MIENNRGYKNKSLQSWAVSYRGKQCLPLQRSLEMLASSLMPVKAYSSSAQCGSAQHVWSKSVTHYHSAYELQKFSKNLVQFGFVYHKTRENKRAIGVRSFDLFQI